MFNFLNFSKKELVAVIDIEDGSVGGMLMSLDKEKDVPEKLFSIRKELPYQKNFSYKRFFYSTMQAISAVSAEILKSGKGAPDRILCIVGSHFYISQTRVIKAKYPMSVTATQSLVESLISEDTKLFLEKHLKNELGGAESPNMLLEQKIMQIKLNGYETACPFGKKVSELDISVFDSIIPKIVLNDIRNTISKIFHNDKVEFHSFTFALFDAMRGVTDNKDGFTVVNVENELTEISVIRNGTIDDSISFSLGKNFLIRRVEEKFGTVTDEAISYLKMFTAKSGEPEVLEKISAVVKEAGEEWSKALRDNTKRMSVHHLLPEHFFFIGGRDFSEIFLDYARKADMASVLFLDKPSSVESLSKKTFDKFCKNVSDCPDDIYFLISSILAKKLFMSPEQHHLFRRKCINPVDSR